MVNGSVIEGIFDNCILSSFVSFTFPYYQYVLYMYVTKNICVAEIMYDESDEYHTTVEPRYNEVGYNKILL